MYYKKNDLKNFTTELRDPIIYVIWSGNINTKLSNYLQNIIINKQHENKTLLSWYEFKQGTELYNLISPLN